MFSTFCFLCIVFVYSSVIRVAPFWRTKDNCVCKLNGKRATYCSKLRTTSTTMSVERTTIRWGNFIILHTTTLKVLYIPLPPYRVDHAVVRAESGILCRRPISFVAKYVKPHYTRLLKISSFFLVRSLMSDTW